MEQKKYILLEDVTRLVGLTKVFRIRALRDFGDVKAGDLGGFIEKEENLSHEGGCWVGGNATVLDYAKIYENAQAYGNAMICSYAKVYGNAQVYGNSMISGDAQVYGNARIRDFAMVFSNAQVYEDAQIFGEAWISGNAKVYGNAQVFDQADVRDNAIVRANSKIFKSAVVHGDRTVTGEIIFLDRYKADMHDLSISQTLLERITTKYKDLHEESHVFPEKEMKMLEKRSGMETDCKKSEEKPSRKTTDKNSAGTRFLITCLCVAYLVASLSFFAVSIILFLS